MFVYNSCKVLKTLSVPVYDPLQVRWRRIKPATTKTNSIYGLKNKSFFFPQIVFIWGQYSTKPPNKTGIKIGFK